MKWILLVLIYNSVSYRTDQDVLTTHTFNNKPACEAAAQWVKGNAKADRVIATCIEDKQ